MQGHNSALGLVTNIEMASVIVSVVIWILVAGCRNKPRILRQVLCVFGALATTVALFIPFLFVDLFAGRSGEAMLATLPLTLLGAPVAFLIILYVSRKIAR